jgi:hypothetical protein
MPWIRWDTSILFDEFCESLSGDEFKAWVFLLLYVKASGARGSAPAISDARLSRMAKVSESAIQTMFEKAGDRFKLENGRISVKNWHRYQEDHRDRIASPVIPSEAINGLTITPQDTTLQDPTERKDIVSRKTAIDAKDLTEKDFILRLDADELKMFVQTIQRMIVTENEARRNNPFIWKPTTGSLEADLRSLIYKPSDPEKVSILQNAYSAMGEKMNWPNYVEKCIQVTIRSSAKGPVHKPMLYTMSLFNKPQAIISSMADGSLASTIRKMK